MRNFLTLISTAVILATPALAQARGFDSNFPQAVTGPFNLEVVVSEDLAYRANNLPGKRSDRNSPDGLNAGFASDGRLGERDINFLLEDLETKLVRDFDKRGLSISDSATTIMRVTIVKAKPNRPTGNQLRTNAAQSFGSFGTGGADVAVEFLNGAGTVVGAAEYDYYSSFNERVAIPSGGVWPDASRAFSRFSHKLAKKLAKMSKAGS